MRPPRSCIPRRTPVGPGAAAAEGEGGPSGEGLPSVLASYQVTPYAAWRFEESTCRAGLLEHFHAASLDGFGCEGKPLAIRAAGGLLQYLQETQKEGLPQLAGLRTYSVGEFMTLDEATRRNLELTETIRGGSAAGSLLSVLDATLTPMGGRLLRRWLGQPLLSVPALERRLDGVASWQGEVVRRTELRELLRGLGDLERWTNRCVQGIALPRDLIGIREALGRVERISGLLAATGGEAPLDACPDIGRVLWQAIGDDPPATLASLGIIRPGYSAELDGIHLATRDAKSWIANLESVERARTGIKSLKVGYNRVFGYYIEVTQANSTLVPSDYIRKQTLVNAERYITPELKEYESLVLNAEERVLELEGQLYRQVLAQIGAGAVQLLRTAGSLPSWTSSPVLPRWRTRTGTSGPSSPRMAASTSGAAAIPSWSVCWPAARPLRPTTPTSRPSRRSSSLPGRTWPASRRGSARSL